MKKHNAVTIFVVTDDRLKQDKSEIVFNVDGVDIPTGIKGEEPADAAKKLAKKLWA